MMHTRTLPLLLLLWTALALPSEAVALYVSDSVQVEVWEIRATKSNNKISPELRPIAAQLKKQFKLTGFTLVKVSRGTTKVKDTHVARLSLGYSARVTPLSVSGNRLQLGVEVKRLLKKRVNAKISLPKGGMQLFGGWEFPGSKNGDVMIVGFRAR